jgi:hypothetical protein
VAESGQGLSSNLGVIGIPTTLRIVLYTIQKFYALSTEYIYVLSAVLRAKNGYSSHAALRDWFSQKTGNMLTA